MKISVDNKFIARNKKIAQYTLYLSLALLAFGFIWSIRNTDPEKTLIGWAILLPSYFLVQLSIYMANKWGKSPRPDEIVTQSLKGLNDEYTLYNFTTAVQHLLIGPQGIWVLNPYHQKGVISFDPQKSSYRQKGGAGLIGKFFGQEGLPKIAREAENLQKDIELYFAKQQLPLPVKPEVVNLFISEEVEISGSNFPQKCIRADKVKSIIRNESKTHLLSPQNISEIKSKLPAAT
jgi:hypothetical protein